MRIEEVASQPAHEIKRIPRANQNVYIAPTG
jgi:hypothetical protein